MSDNLSDNPFRMFKITRKTAERYWSDLKFTEHDRSFYVACRDEQYKEGDLVAAKFGDDWILGRAKRKRKEILVEIMLNGDGEIWGQPAWFPRSDVLPVAGLQTSIF